jgi:thiol:disulfide interchange protein DsbD
MADIHTIQTPEVQREIREQGVTLLLADWTNPDKEIEQSLVEYGVSSLPLTVIYPARRNGKPVLLRGPVTSEQVLAALKQSNP